MLTTVSVRTILVEQTERTRQSSKADIERFIEESELKITSLESQISALSALVELRDRERACVDALRYIISPIRALPVELLVEIFRFAIDEETHVKDAYRISQICSDWRKIAHATLRIWTGPICIDLGCKEISGQGHYVDGLEAWLARSAPLPLPVSLELDGANIDIRTLEFVRRIAPRLRSLRCESQFPLWLISRIAECRLDSLEQLELGLADDSPNISVSPAFTMVPRLRKLSMTIYSHEPHVLTPWAQLTDLTLDSDSPDLILDILAQCTSLTHASICTSGWHSYAGSQLIRPPLIFCHLHTLSLDFGFPQHIMEFFGLPFHPRIGRTASEFYANEGEDALEILCGPYALTSHELIVALEHTVHLTHLKLAYPHEHSLDNDLIDALSCKDNVVPLAPDLHNLVLDNIEEVEVSTDALKRLLFSRWRADGEITSLSGLPAVASWSRVELWGIYSEEYVDSMETLQRQGLPLGLNVKNLQADL
ncbi:F-box domain-containing protein [Mycena sanguinolenta]|uniref:F-box domain-containing protein n=1 Tax=Mycena sanguinolenta TaxID=230812 RepID=A0A8H6YGH8_9AGAR|nr:F-box domain-containing protein [Mycena sanguinolenta]